MAKRKTRSQKLRTKRRPVVISLPDNEPFKVNMPIFENVGSSKTFSESDSLYMFDPRLIMADVKKTVLLSGLMVGVLLALWFLWG